MRRLDKRKKLLTFGRPVIQDEDIREVIDTLKSGWIGPGPKVAQFEAGCREYLGAKYVIALESCTAALFLSMLVAGIGRGDEVITTPMTYCATVNAIIQTGAMPVFVDIDPDTMLMDPERIEEAITPRTRAVIPVHLYGRPCRMDRILEIAGQHNLTVIQDAAHCFEGRYEGKKMGNFGHMTCFSFYANKSVVTAKGGMVSTNRENWAKEIQLLKDHGLTRNAWDRFSEDQGGHYEVKAPGFNYAMTDIHASLGIHQLERVERQLRRREDIWNEYDTAFADLPVTLPGPCDRPTVHARHLYTLLVDSQKCGISRDEMKKRLFDFNVGTSIHYISLHLHEYYRKRFQLKPEDYPVAKSISEQTLSLPLSAGLSAEDVRYVIRAIENIFS